MVIEGYIGTVPRFIHEVRRVSPGVRVLHYCLDTYPDLALIKALDVDGFLTNSWTLLPELVSGRIVAREVVEEKANEEQEASRCLGAGGRMLCAW